MSENVNRQKLIDEIDFAKNLLENDVNLEVKESFISDTLELLKEEITFEDYSKKLNDLLIELNSTLTTHSSEQNERLIKNEYEFNLNENTFRFEFYHKKNNSSNSLNFTHFDKLIDGPKITKKRDLVVPILLFLAILITFGINLYSLLFLSLPIFNVILQLFLCYKKNDKIIWVNESSIDIFRKWGRRRKIPDIQIIYFLLSWLNMWLFSGFLLGLYYHIQKDSDILVDYIGKLAIKTGLINIDPFGWLSEIIYSFIPREFVSFTIRIGILIWIIFFIFYGLTFLLRIWSLNIFNTGIISSLILLVGFLSKDYWAFIGIVLVIVNQVLSKDIIFMSTNVSIEKIQMLEKYSGTHQGKINEVKLKFLTNTAIALLYLFIIIFNESLIIRPTFAFFGNNLPNFKLLDLFIIGTERIFVLSLMFFIFRLPELNVKKYFDKIQLLLNFISDVIYKNNEFVAPKFVDEIQLFKNEKIDAIETITNLVELPSDIKVIWAEEPNWDMNQDNCLVEVIVIYSDRRSFTHQVSLIKSNTL